jgi:hypothetical protein
MGHGKRYAHLMVVTGALTFFLYLGAIEALVKYKPNAPPAVPSIGYECLNTILV